MLQKLSGESLKHADPLLCLPLSLCYTCMFIQMPQSIKIQLLYHRLNKSSDLTDKNSYMPIALSSIASNVFEHVIILKA